MMGDLGDWLHLDAIQALVHHASAVITAIFIFAITARLIAYLIPDGHAKKLVMIIDDVVLLAVFGLAGWRLLNYMWLRPHAQDTAQQVQIVRPVASVAGNADALIADCRRLSPPGDYLLQCLRQKKVQANQAMAAAAARMSTDMRALDKVGSSKIGAARSFDAAQATFLLYREAECRWLSTSARNGAPDDIYQACMADLARQRAAQIEQILHR
jgi:uncharacterized protein YecT (DUF1311 family)